MSTISFLVLQTGAERSSHVIKPNAELNTHHSHDNTRVWHSAADALSISVGSRMLPGSLKGVDLEQLSVGYFLPPLFS